MPEQGPPGSLVPGSFRSTISLGKGFVQAPTPWQAGWNEFLRGIMPHGPLTVDPSPTGFAGGTLGKGGRALPYVGSTVIGPFLAAEAARQKQGQMVELPPRNPTMDVLDTLRNIFRLTPGTAGFLGSVGTGVAKGLTGWFQGHPDRTGVAAGMQAPELSGQGAPVPPSPMIAPAIAPSFAGRFNRYNLPGENPFINPATGVAPAWAGGPSTWNQPRSSWGIPSPEESLQVRPTINPWAVPTSFDWDSRPFESP